jgi:hypothetical protein
MFCFAIETIKQQEEKSFLANLV